MSAELETIGAASGSSALIAIAVVIIKDWVKNRNGGANATRSDIKELRDDVSGLGAEVKAFTKSCYERHLPIGRELSSHSARLDNLEKDDGKN